MERLWTGPFVTLTIGMLALFTGFYFLLPTLPLFIQDLGGSQTQVGLVSGVFTLTAVLFRPLVGGLLDRYGRRPFIIGGLLLFAVAMYAYDWIGGIAALLALRFLHGVSWAMSTTAVGTAITDIIPPARRGEGMGWYGMAMTIAMAIGPMAGLWLIEEGSFRAVVLVATGLSVLAFALAFAAKTPFERSAGRQPMKLFEKSLLPVTIAILFLAVAYGGITTFLSLFAVSIGVNAGLFFLVYAIALTLIRPMAGKLSDRYGEAGVIIPSLVVTVAALIVLSLASGVAGVVTAAVLYGIGFGSAQPALQACALRMARPDQKGVANASFFTAFDLGIGLGSIALGGVSQFAGYPALFVVCAASAGLSLVVFVVAVRARLPRSRQAAGEEAAV
ncbi:MFS transporter [Paenibacillus methanolicus]|uniref:Putative MFS family arabinose efflux permease n=1 Tax=Paenibacillus methanolicus TaxID=582686 RepID=A0A5S5C3G5_9BACL|nr:MFS transporter [Paenibacillus methanolicus]TYP73961.1 putative MFS family arabinose efflux permease [Paenibacillus methanolicus]